MKMSRLYLVLLSLTAYIPMSVNASPFMSSVDKHIDHQYDGFSINGAIGTLGGEANEYVYTDSGEKLSQLNWKIKSASVIKGEMNYDMLPWLTANLNGWSTFKKGTGVMDDYDWLNPLQKQWTHWSHHENTELRYANDVDVNLRAWLLQDSYYKLGVMAGYEINDFRFLAKGGCFQMYNGRNSGCFSYNLPVIGYEQSFSTPYLGLNGKYLVNDFELNAIIKVSPLAQARDVDDHYLRDLTFKEYNQSSQFYSASFAAGYYVTPEVKVFADATYNRYMKGKADTQVLDHRLGIVEYFENAAGIANKNYVLSLGVQYRF